MEMRIKVKFSLSICLLTKAMKEDHAPQPGESQDANKSIHDLS